MSFASLPFVGLVAAGVILYYLVPKKLQWVVLLLASMVFYLAGGVKSAVWLVLVAAVTWLTGLLLARQNARPAPDKQTKAAVRHVKKRICAVCAVLYPAGLNIDYYPTNFVPRGETLYYIDYECNAYMEQWDFEHWGAQYWTEPPSASN